MSQTEKIDAIHPQKYQSASKFWFFQIVENFKTTVWYALQYAYYLKGKHWIVYSV